MECLRPLRERSDTDRVSSRHVARPLSFGFDPRSWNFDPDHEDTTATREAILDMIALQPRQLYELSGEAASGKTQLSLQLCVRAVLSGLRDASSPCFGRAVYLFTEGGTLKMDRLRQIAASRLGDEALTDAVMRHVHVEYATTVDSVISKLVMLEDVLREGTNGAEGVEGIEGMEGIERAWGDGENGRTLPRPPVKLFVLDSIAHVFRFREDSKYDSYDMSRSQAFFKIASILKRYADEYDLVVLVTNQVVDVLDDVSGGQGGEGDRPGCAGLKLETSGRAVYPALGLAWASCVTGRLFVSKLTAICEETRAARSVVVDDAGGIGGSRQLRGMQVVFAPEMKQMKAHFVVETCGCVGVDVGRATFSFG